VRYAFHSDPSQKGIFIWISRIWRLSLHSLLQYIQGVPKSDTLINYVNIMSYKLQNTGYLHCLNNFNICYYWFIQLCAQCGRHAAVHPKRVFRSVWWCTILLESPSVLTTLDSDIRQQSFAKNTFAVIRAAYFCKVPSSMKITPVLPVRETPTETIMLCI